MAVTPKGSEMAGRLRAARGYSGLKQPELATELGISKETLGRMERGAGTVPEGMPAKIAAACGVPSAFMELGFVPLERELTDADRVAAQLAERIEELEQRLEATTPPEAVLAIDSEEGRRLFGLPQDILDQLRGVIAETVDERLAAADAASTRFASAARQEARQQAEHPPEAPGAPSDERDAAEGRS